MEERNLHSNNAAEWALTVLLYPAWLAVVAWSRVRRFASFVASWLK